MRGLQAGSLGGGRKAIIDTGALDVIKACLHFHEGNAADQELHDVLQLEACRAVHALMSDKFGMNDIHADTDFNKYYGILCRYKADIEARAEGEDGMPVPEEELDELQACHRPRLPGVPGASHRLIKLPQAMQGSVVLTRYERSEQYGLPVRPKA